MRFRFLIFFLFFFLFLENVKNILSFSLVLKKKKMLCDLKKTKDKIKKKKNVKKKSGKKKFFQVSILF
jgi:hypothetical protein